MKTFVGSHIRDSSPCIDNRVLNIIDNELEKLVYDDLSWAIRSSELYEISGTDTLDIDKLDQLIQKARLIQRQSCSTHVNNMSIDHNLHISIHCLHESGLIYPIFINNKSIKYFDLQKLSQTVIVEHTDVDTYCNYMHPFVFTPLAFPVVIDFSITITSFCHDLDQLLRSIDMPDWPIFRRQRKQLKKGHINPTRVRIWTSTWKSGLDTWEKYSANLITSIWKKLVDAHQESVDIFLEVWPEIREGQSQCAFRLPTSIINLSTIIPINIRILYSGLRHIDM